MCASGTTGAYPSRSFRIYKALRPLPNGIEHGLGEPASERILLARMVAAEHRSSCEVHLDAVRELGAWHWDTLIPALKDSQNLIEGEPPERHNDASRAKNLQLLLEIWPAVIPFGGGRAVRRRRTADGCSDVGSRQTQPVLGCASLWLVGKPSPVQSPIQPVPGTISGEHSPSPIGAMGARGETDDQELRVRVPE